MNSFEIGRMIKQQGGFRAFIPSKFPPAETIALPDSLTRSHVEAIRLIGKLDGVTHSLPDKDSFLMMFVRRDATSSSQIEGTRATIIDAIEADNVEPRGNLPIDVDDILHYINAMNYGLRRTDELPFLTRLICELHKVLMKGARATQNSFPGELRKTQNWIGGTRPDNALFVPPPAEDMQKALSDLERFIHTDDGMSPLVKAGLLHAQFETIHPFTDGNGRTGRLLVTLYLWQEKMLELPVLYLSTFFKKHQKLYYEKLDRYHSGEVFEWLSFFFDGISTIASSAINTCTEITKLRDRDMQKIQSLGKTSAVSSMNILLNLFKIPVVGIADIVKWSGFTPAGGYKMIDRLMNMNILVPLKEESSYAQKWVYSDYLELFTEEGEG